MDRQEKAAALLANAEKFDIVFEIHDGVLELKRAVIDDLTALLLQELDTYRDELRFILEKRNLAARGRQLIGRRVLSPEFGDATIIASELDGRIIVRTQPPMDSTANPVEMSADLKSLLVLPDVETATGSSPQPSLNDGRRSWLGDLMRRAKPKGETEEKNRFNWWR